MTRKLVSFAIVIAFLFVVPGEASACSFVGSSFCDAYGGCGGCPGDTDYYLCTIGGGYIIVEAPGGCCICTME
jgi:hypothetical protein